MQGLVSVGFWDCNVILELAGHRFIQVVHHAQYAVTGIHIVDDNAERVDVEYFRKRPHPIADFFIQAVQMFLPAEQTTLQFLLLYTLQNSRFNLVEDFLAIATRLFHRIFQHPVTHRVQRGKTEIFKFQAHLVHAQPIGNGRVNIQCLARNAAALFAAHHTQRSHVVQAIGKLDQDDADIAHHGQHHLAEVFRLCLSLAFKLDLGELADAIDQFGHFFTELTGHHFLGGAGILYNIVQDAGDDALGVHVHFSKYVRHRNGVIDIRLPRHTVLTFMRFRAKQIGTVNLPDLVCRQVGFEQVTQVTDQKP